MIDLIHISDHLQRLVDRCQEDGVSIEYLITSQYPKEGFELLCELIGEELKFLENNDYAKAAHHAKKSVRKIKKYASHSRDTLTELIADGTVDIIEGGKALDAMKWLDRVSTHISRISRHLEGAAASAGALKS